VAIPATHIAATVEEMPKIESRTADCP
jgi:hypothetical protein